jgi:ribosome-binding factor A
VSWRLERIGEQVRGELARLLRDEVRDPRVGLVPLTRVEVAPDLATASVFWSRLVPDSPAGGEAPADESGEAADEAVAEVERGLRSAAGFLRGRLARELSLRRTPELRFRHDPSIARGAEMLTLIRTLTEERDAREQQAEAANEGGDERQSEAGGAPQERDGSLDEETKERRTDE